VIVGSITSKDDSQMKFEEFVCVQMINRFVISLSSWRAII
jgi:hypothetical protein